MQRTMLLLVMLILFAGCQVPWHEPEVEQGCDALPAEERDACFYNQAIEQSDARLCRSILTIAQRERCFMELAKEMCDTTLCDHVKVLYKPLECQQQIEHSTHCQTAEEPAQPLQEIQEIDEEAGLPPEGLAPLPGSKEDLEDPCSAFGGDQRDFCFQKAALDAGDASLCEQVVGERYAGSDVNPAKNKCYFMLAISQCAPTLCDQVRGEERPFTGMSCKQRISQECP